MNSTRLHQRNPLEIAELAAFDANIASLGETEQRQRRIAYLQQALQQVGYGKSIMKAMGCFMIPMVIIPIFWPILLVVYFSFKHSRRALDHYVASACRYWNIDPDRDLNIATGK